MAQPVPPVVWEPTRWHGEEALQSTSDGWRAIVSVDRGRLVHFGPAAGDVNLLFAPATRDAAFGWGGHRVWLGPQKDWTGGWPPPAAWEQSAAPGVQQEPDGTLRLGPISAGDGWPTFHRTYRWFGTSLVCGVTLEADGKRPAQVVQIVQFPASTQVRARREASAAAGADYVGLPRLGRADLVLQPPLPPGAKVTSDAVELVHAEQIEKLGFPPTVIEATIGGSVVEVRRGRAEGEAVDFPDDGYGTQVYLGGQEPFIELEQLSRRWQGGTPATFELVLVGVRTG